MPTVKILIPTPLRTLTAGQEAVSADADSIATLMRALDAQHPGIGGRLLDAQGNLRRFVNLYVNGEDVRFLQGKDTPLRDGDEVDIVPAIAGGPGTNIDIPGMLDRDAYVDIYVQDESVSEQKVKELQKQAIRLMEVCGFGLGHEYPEERGSWFKRLLFHSKKPLSSEEAHNIYEEGREALQAAAKGEPATRVDINVYTEAKKLIELIQPFDNVTIRLGDILVEKFTVRGEANLIIERLPNLSQDFDCRLSRKTRMKSVQNRPLKVFISYSHKDVEAIERFQAHLKPLEREGLVERWDDTRLRTGQRWKEEIQKALSSAKVAVLLISENFLASDFIAEDELPPLLASAQDQGVQIMPVILKPCGFKRNRVLSQFQSVNPPEKPVLGMSDIEQGQIWEKLIDDIQDALSTSLIA